MRDYKIIIVKGDDNWSKVISLPTVEMISLPTVEIAPLPTIQALGIHLKLQIWKPYNNIPIVEWLIKINPKILTQATVGLNCQVLAIIF
jgi:hypothetical protein